MQGGDLSNRLPPRWLIVFEGVIAEHEHQSTRARYDFYIAARQWRRAINTFNLNIYTGKVLWDMTWRQDYKFDVATFLPGGKTDKHVAAWLDTWDVPYSNVRQYPSPAALARALVTMPDVHAVIHADESSRFTYGHRGRLVQGSGWSI